MKKKPILTVVLLAAVLILAGGGYYLLQRDANGTGVKTEEKTFSIGVSGYDQYNVANDIKKMTIQNGYGTFTFTPDPTVDGVEDKSWFLNDLDNVKSDAYAVNDIALAFYTVTASKRLEVPAAELANYGFDKPELTVTLDFADGSVITYSFGTSVALTNSESDYLSYVMRSGDDSVYLVENYYYEKAFISLKDVMKTELYPQLEDGVIIQELTFGGTGGDALKILNNTENYVDYRITEPFERTVDSTAISALMGELDIIKDDVTVEIAGTKSMPLSPDTLAMYGLQTPVRTLNFKYTVESTTVGSDGKPVTTKTDGQHTLRLGIVYGNCVYVTVDDVNAIYSVPYSALSAVYEASFDSLADRNIYTEKLINIDEIKFDTSFKTFDYKLVNSTEVNSVTLNGKSIDVSAIKSLYTTFASMAYSERVTDKPSAAPYMTVTVKLTTGGTDVIQIIPYNSRKYFVTVNGQGNMLISYELADDLMNALKATDKTSLG
ncbi:MAG TPA: DUF4340 domain-containing protein [Oscillospiraceae bacterium]|nr:DUF4340 domain-containing protein [Oscillospiraceae bacterium]HPS35056.1 DUF4340 domain-containing protein [Oscillospiraceae bacterium]